MLQRRFISVFLLFALMLPSVVLGQGEANGATAATAARETKVYTAPKETIDRIKKEGMENSQVMQTLSYLTDVIGGRLTNSPNMKRANEWTRDTMAKWGLQNAHLEAWGPFGRGWSLKSFNAQVVAPQAFPVIAYPKAWTTSTKGAVTADVVLFDAKTEADLERFKGKLNGKIVLVSDMREVKAAFDGLGTRRSDEDLKKMAEAALPAPQQQPQQPNAEAQARQREQFLFSLKRWNFLLQEGA